MGQTEVKKKVLSQAAPYFLPLSGYFLFF